MSEYIEVAARKVDSGQLCFIIAEAGAGIVTFQIFKAEQVISAIAPTAEYQSQTIGLDEAQPFQTGYVCLS